MVSHWQEPEVIKAWGLPPSVPCAIEDMHQALDFICSKIQNAELVRATYHGYKNAS